MSPARAAVEVARWEFARYFKPRQQLAGLLLALAGAGVGFGIAKLASGGTPTPVEVAVIGADRLPLPAESERGRVRFSPHPQADAEALRAAVGRDELAGLLTIHDRDQAELLVHDRGGWVAELEATLSAARRDAAMADARLEPETLARILAPVRLEVVHHPQGPPPRPAGRTLGFSVVIGLMILGIFTGMGYVFASITGEKQQRVTEQVVAAIPPQSWIDGKILGLAAVSLVSVANMAAAFGILVLVLRLAGRPLALPASLGNPGHLLLMALFAILGFFFWFAFLAAVAALIDDPHNSSRTQLLMLPVLAVGASFLALGNPDGGLVRALALLPPFSASMLPARLLLVNVPGWEVVLSLLLLAAAVVGLRRVAGRVFEVGMLMYGKEPSWAEVRRWLRPQEG
jgi:ABC-2 type transport system permease protein